MRPATDDKVLAAWNGLASAALAEAGRVLGDRAYVAAAERAASFVLEHLRGPDGRLLRSWREGVAGRPGFGTTTRSWDRRASPSTRRPFEPRWFERALELAGDLRRLFADPAAGGFFQTGTDADTLGVRPKELYDNAGAAAGTPWLQICCCGSRPSRATPSSRPRRCRRSGSSPARSNGRRERSATPCARWTACSGRIGRSRSSAIRTPPHTAALVATVTARRFRPNLVLAVAEAGDAAAAQAVPLLRGRSAPGGVATAYVCERFACRLPVTDPRALAEQLDAG